jgi:hypothetical protein
VSRRVRFVGIDLLRPRPGAVRARVELEWADRVSVGEEDGETGQAGELRACAGATLRAIEEILGVARFSLVGVRATRIFDADLVAVAVTGLEERKLIGACLVTDGFPRAAALAILNATNRKLEPHLPGSG